jgi:hypothetical protein
MAKYGIDIAEIMFAVVDPETQAKLTGLPEEVKSRLQAALAALAGI